MHPRVHRAAYGHRTQSDLSKPNPLVVPFYFTHHELRSADIRASERSSRARAQRSVSRGTTCRKQEANLATDTSIIEYEYERVDRAGRFKQFTAQSRRRDSPQCIARDYLDCEIRTNLTRNRISASSYVPCAVQPRSQYSRL